MRLLARSKSQIPQFWSDLNYENLRSLQHLADAFGGELDLVERRGVGHADKARAASAEGRTRHDRHAELLQELQRERLIGKACRPDVRATGLSDEEFALKLLKEFGVACVPGSAFGACGAGFVRMSYATSMEKIRLAVERLGRMLGNC